MCIIIIKQKGKDVPTEVLKTSARINPHGLGIVWLDTFKVSYHKSKEYQLLNTERPYIAHFRYATIGKICKENTHPFRCGHNKDELFMMNGTARGYGNERMTDTEDLAIRLGRTPRHTWGSQLEKFEARFVSINTRTRTFQIYNKLNWIKKDGVWYSKGNVLQDNLVAVYGTLKKGFGNYYTYLTSSKHLGNGKTKDKYPLVVDGLPYLFEKKGKGHNVKVDVFKVSQDKLKSLDLLEGHPRWYKRKQIPIIVKDRELMCWVYFNPQEEGRWNGKNHTESYEYQKPKYNYKPFTFDEPIVVDDRQAELDFECDVESNSPYCTACFNDLIHDGISDNYQCVGCGAEYTKDEIDSSYC